MNNHKVHSHPQMERKLGVPSDHVIIDKDEFMKILEVYDMAYSKEKTQIQALYEVMKRYSYIHFELPRVSLGTTENNLMVKVSVGSVLKYGNDMSLVKTALTYSRNGSDLSDVVADILAEIEHYTEGLHDTRLRPKEKEER